MKGIWVVVTLLLAGCTLPGEETEEPDLFGSCPHWVAGDEAMANATVNGTARLDVEIAVHELRGDPLDMFVLTFETDAPIKIKVHSADGRRLLVKDGDDTVGFSFVDVDGEKEVRAFLTSTDHGAPAAPSDIYLDLEGNGDIQVTATPFYRVCGVLAA